MRENEIQDFLHHVENEIYRFFFILYMWCEAVCKLWFIRYVLNDLLG